ncbi:MAG: adaptor protein MecA [Clostridia bacterium]|nr:adaptor protein MecA [Clostridia bacterium]
MELIRISDSKLKIMLNAEDMAHYAITSDLLNYENTETRRIVWQILDEAKHKTGFDAASDRVLIQVYPSRTGGCEMYVTKVPPPLPHPSEGDNMRTREGRSELYLFTNLEGLLQACRQLACHMPLGESTVYALEGGGYYLLLRGEAIDTATGAPPAYCPAEEYGERKKCTAARMAYIKEHAVCLCEKGAIEQFSVLS